MRRLAILTLLIPALALLVGTSGCGPAKKDTPAPPAPGTKDKEKTPDTPPTKGGAALDAPTDGVIIGRVIFDGTPPKGEAIEAMLKHKDKDGCLAGTENEKNSQKWLVDGKGGVANVLVFLAPPSGKSFNVDDIQITEKEVVVDQPHCAFIPHVFAVYTGDGKKGGQVLKVKNSAPFNHNTKITGDPLKNPPMNVTLNPKEEKEITLKYQGQKQVKVSCDFHPWMEAIGFTFNHPYFAITKEDGTFEIKGVPTGAEVNLVAWHEGADYFNGGAKGMPITLKKGENAVELKVSAK